MPAMAGCIEWRSQYRKSFVTTHHLLVKLPLKIQRENLAGSISS
jgi:hypothetical protein